MNRPCLKIFIYRGEHNWLCTKDCSLIILFLECKFTSLFIRITLSEKCVTKFFQIRNPNTSSSCIFAVVPFSILNNFNSLFTGVTSCVRSGSLSSLRHAKIQRLYIHKFGWLCRHVFWLNHVEKGSTHHGSVHPRASIVQRTAPNYRLAAVDHATRPPVGKNH